MLIVLKEGKLIFIDVKTMMGKQRTVSFLPAEDQTETAKELLEIIESARAAMHQGPDQPLYIV